MESLKVFIYSIFKPLKAFRIIEKKWGFKIYWFTALIILISIAVSTFILIPQMEDLQSKQTKDSLSQMGISEEELKQFEQLNEENPFAKTMQYITIFLAPIMTIIGWLFMALLYLGLILVFGGDTKYKQVLTIVIISSVPVLISNLVNMFYTLYTGKFIIHRGLSGLVASGNIMANSSNLLYIILSRVDMFILWGLILLILGFVISCKMKVWKSVLTVLIFFILGIIVAMVLSSLGRMFLGGMLPK